jgi:hypothetical protein
MLFSGSSFFLSPKLPIPDTRTLRELINSNGGKICSNASNKETFIIVDSWDVVRQNHPHKQGPLFCGTFRPPNTAY